MDFKLLAGGLAVLAGAALIGQPQGDAGDAAHVAEFKTQCQRGMGGSKAATFCRCVARGVEGRLESPEEHRLAGGILRAIGETQGAQRMLGSDPDASITMLRIKLDRLSQDFQDTVSVARKQDVLSAVTGEVPPCEPELSR